ncbi:MAG: hypothetical protein JWO46_1666 [Nocardioidaceae bacterium]|nr:hypothetical protein [Nocardioidaceae bacterium]
MQLSRRAVPVLVVTALLVVLAVVATTVLVIVPRLHRSPLQQALDLVPASSLRVGFTDWAAVRDRLASGPVRSEKALDALLSKAYDTDLSAASSIDESAEALRTHYGFSPANATWEAYAQSRTGAVMVLKMPDSVDLDTVADKLDALGYGKPRSDAGAWTGGAELVSQIDPTISPELQYVVLDRDRHLVLASDTLDYVRTAAKVARGDAKSMSGDDVSGVAGRAGTSAAAFVWSNGFACEDLAMSQAAPEDQKTGEGLVRRAGGVTPLDGLVVGLSATRRLTVALGFENDRQADHDLKPRATLLVGPAVVRSGSYADDLRLTRSHTDGSTVLLELRAKQRTGPVLTTLASGPVLFATC